MSSVATLAAVTPLFAQSSSPQEVPNDRRHFEPALFPRSLHFELLVVRDERRFILLSSHSINDVERVSDRVLMLDRWRDVSRSLVLAATAHIPTHMKS